jgi:hypothetical protein
MAIALDVAKRLTGASASPKPDRSRSEKATPPATRTAAMPSAEGLVETAERGESGNGGCAQRIAAARKLPFGTTKPDLAQQAGERPPGPSARAPAEMLA